MPTAMRAVMIPFLNKLRSSRPKANNSIPQKRGINKTKRRYLVSIWLNYGFRKMPKKWGGCLLDRLKMWIRDYNAS